jgi:hypothetical protein
VKLRHTIPSQYNVVPSVFFDFFSYAEAKTQWCKQQYNFARKALQHVTESECHTMAIIVARMVIRDEGTFLIWSTVQYAFCDSALGRADKVYQQFQWEALVKG